MSTPAEFVAEVARAARLAMDSTGESIPKYAERMGVSYPSLFRLLHGEVLRIATLEKLHSRIVGLGAPPHRPAAGIRYLGRVSYLRSVGALTAPYLEVQGLGAVNFLLGDPSSGKTTLLHLLAAASDPLGPWVRRAARSFGHCLADAVRGDSAELTAVGPAGQVRTRWVRTAGADPLRIEVQARAAGKTRRITLGSLHIPSEEADSLVQFSGQGNHQLRSDPGIVKTLRAAGVRGRPERLGRSALAALGAAQCLLAAQTRPGLVLIDEDIPVGCTEPLAEMARAAADAGSQVVWVVGEDHLAAQRDQTILRVRRSAAGAVRGEAVS